MKKKTTKKEVTIAEKVLSPFDYYNLEDLQVFVDSYYSDRNFYNLMVGKGGYSEYRVIRFFSAVYNNPLNINSDIAPDEAHVLKTLDKLILEHITTTNQTLATLKFLGQTALENITDVNRDEAEAIINQTYNIIIKIVNRLKIVRYYYMTTFTEPGPYVAELDSILNYLVGSYDKPYSIYQEFIEEGAQLDIDRVEAADYNEEYDNEDPY